MLLPLLFHHNCLREALMFSARNVFALLCAAVVLASGCGRSSPVTYEERVMAEGTVTINGEPLAAGEIVFESPDDVINGISPGFGSITEGHYRLSVSLGTKTVRIFAPVAIGKPDDTGLTPTRETLPAIYNVTSELQATITADGPRTFDFDLTTPPPGKPSRRR